MYDYNLDDNEQPPPFDHTDGTLQPNHQHHCGTGGIWAYVCSRFIGSFGHMAPASLTFQPPPCMANCCHISGDQSSNHTTTLSVADHPEKPKKYSMDNKPTVRVYCKSLVKYSMTICDGKVTLAPTNTSDPHQHWIKEEKFGENVKDEQGHSSFALVNKATGHAIKHSIGQTYPVQLIKYDPDKLDETVLWTRGVTQEEGYSAIRAVYNIHLNLDAYDCTKDLEKRAEIFQFSWNKAKHQQWSLAFYCK